MGMNIREISNVNDPILKLYLIRNMIYVAFIVDIVIMWMNHEPGLSSTWFKVLTEVKPRLNLIIFNNIT